MTECDRPLSQRGQRRRRGGFPILVQWGVLLSALTQLGFAPFTTDPVTQGNRLFEQGKYDEAKNKYGEALVEDPDSPLINFNMGDAHYKAGNYADAIASYSRVASGGDPKNEAAVAYNIGNAHYQLALAAETDKPQEALKSYAEALIAYRRAVGADPSADDAKYNYELALKKMDELRRRLEEQKKEQQEQQQDQQQQDQQQQEQQDEQQQDQQDQQQQQQEQQQQQDQQQQNEQQQQQDQGEEPQEQEGEQQQQGEESQEPPQDAQPQPGEGDPQPQEAQQAAGQSGEQSAQDSQERRDAAALIDMAADEELQPNEMVRRMQGATVVEPAQDW